jgi:hypothetical protein
VDGSAADGARGRGILAGGRRLRAWEGVTHPAGVYLVRACVDGREHGLRVVKLAP